MDRIVIHSSDVAILMGIHNRTARRLLNKIRKKLEKEMNEPVSVGQFCIYTGLPENEVRKAMKITDSQKILNN